MRDRLELDFGLKTKLSKFRVSYRESITRTVRKNIELSKMINGRPLYAFIELEMEPIPEEEIEKREQALKALNEEKMAAAAAEGKKESKSKTKENKTNFLEFAFERQPIFDQYYNEFRKRKKEQSKQKKKGGMWAIDDDEEEEDDVAPTKDVPKSRAVISKIVRNPMEPEEFEEIEDEYGDDTIYTVESIPFEILWALEQTIENSFSRGILLGSPLLNVRVKVVDLKYSMRRSNPMVFQMACVDLLKEIIQEADPQILEPVSDVEISTPSKLVQELLNDVITVRRGKILEIVEEGGRFNPKDENQRSLIYAVLPLEATIGYATFLRTVTKVIKN